MIDIPDRQTSDIQGPSLLCGIMICLLLYEHRGCLFSPRIGCRVCVFVYVLSMGNIILCKHRARLSGGVVWMRHTVSVRSQRAVCVSPREWRRVYLWKQAVIRSSSLSGWTKSHSLTVTIMNLPWTSLVIPLHLI